MGRGRKNLPRPIAYAGLDLVTVFPPGSHAAPDMPLCLIDIQNVFDFNIKLRIEFFQPFGYIFMYSRFADSELFSRTADRFLVGDDIFTELDRPLLHNAFHRPRPLEVLCRYMYMRQIGRLCNIGKKGGKIGAVHSGLFGYSAHRADAPHPPPGRRGGRRVFYRPPVSHGGSLYPWRSASGKRRTSSSESIKGRGEALASSRPFRTHEK